MLSGCSSKNESNASASIVEDTTRVSDVRNDEVEKMEQRARPTNSVIHYLGSSDDDIKKALETFPPFTSVQALAAKCIYLKDSLELIRDTQPLTDPQDSLVFTPVENNAYLAILDYKKKMASGTPAIDSCPSLLQLSRQTAANDSSINILPKAGPSDFLSRGNFFFLGGAPFLNKLQPVDNTIFADPNGNPERRFESSLTENTNYILTSIYHFKNGPIDIQYGPPLGSYDMGPQEVRGIGSLIHHFVQPVPVLFLTEDGLIPGGLISVTLKLVSENLGCVSDQPYAEFACSQSIEALDILGIYIPYDSGAISTCTVSRPSDHVWTADISGDNIADIACVSGSFEGYIDDTIAQCLWLVNINGVWKIIDWGQMPECT